MGTDKPLCVCGHAAGLGLLLRLLLLLLLLLLPKKGGGRQLRYLVSREWAATPPCPRIFRLVIRRAWKMRIER